MTMQEREWTNEEKQEFVTSLEKQLINALNEATKASPFREDGQVAEMLQVVALVQTMIMILGQVSCAHCRENLREGIELMMPAALDRAMQEPTTQEHIH